MSQAILSGEEKRTLLAKLLAQKAGPDESAWPLSRGQEALWFIHQLASQSAAYNLMYAWRIKSALEIPALQRAGQALVMRHPTLRTVYEMSDGRPVQRTRKQQAVTFEVTDADDWSEEQLGVRVSEAAHRPFNLQQDCMLRLNVYARGAHEYVLLLTVHHIAIDFTSMVRLVAELFEIYGATRAGLAAELPLVKRSYRHYVRWQMELLEGPEGERLWSAWKKKLAGDLPVLNLPTDRPRPAVQTYNGAVHHFQLSEHLGRGLRDFAKSEGLTLYVVLLAAFQILLFRYTGQEDILVGSPFDNRRRAEFEKVIGYFVNPVILRATPSGKLTCREFLQQVRQTVAWAFDHQDYPFPLLVEKLQSPREPSRSPLCDVMFILQKPAGSSSLKREPGKSSPLELLLLGETGVSMNVHGLALEAFALHEQISQLDLTWMMVDTGQAIYGRLPFNTDLFDQATMARFAAHYQVLLEGMVADPARRLMELPLLTETEREPLMFEFNKAEFGYPQDQCIHQLFEQQAALTPKRTAVVYESRQLTYAELNARANQVAHCLRALGIGPESRVGLCVERSLEMVVGLLGVLKAGGAYVPLDPTYPQERLAYMLDDARISVLLTQHGLVERLPNHHAAHVVCFDQDGTSIDEQSQKNPQSNFTSANLAYVIYTSGSTGRPKGVMVEHRAAVNLALAHQQVIYKGCSGSVLRSSLNPPLAFDACMERFMLLLFGHTIYIVPDEIRHDPQAFIDYIERHELDVIDFTPSHLRVLVEAGLLERPGITARLGLVGGEAIDEHFWRQLSQTPGIDFFNVYGPTECTINATACAIKSSPARPVIGFALPNVQIYILDECKQLAPVGVVGEIHVGGAGLSRGYLDAPDLTADKFIPNPFSTMIGARLYRTSDLARYLPGGCVEFLGRNDEQIKIRGYRIDPGEIVAAIARFKGVKEAVVIAREIANGDKRLVAYVVAESGTTLMVDELKEFLKDSIPEYMVPYAYFMLAALPQTPNGKLDRQALPAFEQLQPETEESFVAPRNSIEERLAGIWAQVLNLEQVGINDSFFALGGHSILAAQMILRIREAFDSDLPLRMIFDAPTVSQLALKIVARQLELQDEAIEELLTRVESISEEKTKDLLKANM